MPCLIPEKKKLNVSALRRIQKAILGEPRKFHMSTFATASYPVGEQEDEADFPPCGTVACIAGWAIIHEAKRVGLLEKIYRIGDHTLERLSHKLLGWRRKPGMGESEIESARRILGLSEEQAQSLFFEDKWPSQFKRRYYDAPDDLRRVKAAVARIDYLIKTGK